MRKSTTISLSLSFVLAAAATASAQRASVDVPRDKEGRIARSDKAKDEFKRETGYPHGRPGYVIDHKQPLANGGADDPSNMQWQTTAEAKAKDKWERGGFGTSAKAHASKSHAGHHGGHHGGHGHGGHAGS